MIPKTGLCSTTHVELTNREVVIVTDATKFGAALTKKLKALNAVPVIASTSSALERIETAAKAGSLAGVYYLAGLDEKFDWQSSTPETWRQNRSQQLNPLFELSRRLPESAFLICATDPGRVVGIHPWSKSTGRIGQRLYQSPAPGKNRAVDQADRPQTRDEKYRRG